MTKILSVFTAVILTACLCSCGKNDSTANDKILDSFIDHIQQNDLGEDYYIQISKTAAGENTLTEASKMGDDCAFMEYDIKGSLKFFRNETLTEISATTYFAPDKTDAKWENFEFEGLNEKYRGILEDLLKIDNEKTIEKNKNDDKDFPYSIKIKYDVKSLDTKTLFSNSGNFGSVTIKYDTDKDYGKYRNITVSCQYDYKNIIYIYGVTLGTPSAPDEKGKNGHRPDDIEKIFENYNNMIAQQMAATE